MLLYWDWKVNLVSLFGNKEKAKAFFFVLFFFFFAAFLIWQVFEVAMGGD